MARIPYMQFHIADYLADTEDLTTLEHGAYLLLIMRYYQNGQSLLENDQLLSRFGQLSVQKWLRMKPKIKRFFTIRDGRWYHKRIEAELDEIAKKSVKSRNAALSRWAKEREKKYTTNDADALQEKCDRNADAMPINIKRNININIKPVRARETTNSIDGRSTHDQILERLNYFFSEIQIQQLLTTLHGRLMLKTWEQEGVTSTDIDLVLQAELDAGESLKSPRYYENIILDFSRTKTLRTTKEKKLTHEEKVRNENALALAEAKRRAIAREEEKNESAR
jgi:uncharacterized protein YdaU (DUF1376 family)